MSMNFATDVVVNESNSLQVKKIKALTAMDSETYDVGVANQVLKSNGTITYWGAQNQLDPIATKSYTNVIATSNDNNGAGFFYLRVRPTEYGSNWHVKTRAITTVSNDANYKTDSTFDIYGYNSTYSWYACLNNIRSTSYRGHYYNSVFFASSSGYTNNCSHWIGINLTSATNQTTVARNLTVELLEYENCTVELQDTLVTPTNIPNRAGHTGWYSSTNTSYSNFNACDAGLKQTGDANTTSISNLYHANGNYIMSSALYRYQLVFQQDENTLTPLNNVSNTTGTSKAMLTNVEFDPFGKIFYYNSTTAVSANAAAGAGALFYSISGMDLRYTFNCGTTLTAHQPFYLVVTPTSGGKCKIASATPWAQTLPSFDDGNWYILIGRNYSTYQISLYPYHPIYTYDNGAIRIVTPGVPEVELASNVSSMLTQLGLNPSANLTAAVAGTAETDHAVVQGE